jgi:hypothetical protein
LALSASFQNSLLEETLGIALRALALAIPATPPDFKTLS